MNEQSHDGESHEVEIEIDVEQEPMTDGLGNELREFGVQLMRALRSVTESAEVRNLGKEIGSSLREIGDEIQSAVEAAVESDDVRAVGQKARKVGERVKDEVEVGGVGASLQQGLSQALRSLNDELNRIIDQVQSKSARMSDTVESSVREAAQESGVYVDSDEDVTFLEEAVDDD